MGYRLFIGMSVLMGMTAAPATAAAEDPVRKLEPTATLAEACNMIFGPGAFVDVPSEGKVAPGDRFSVDVAWGTGWKDGASTPKAGTPSGRLATPPTSVSATLKRPTPAPLPTWSPSTR